MPHKVVPFLLENVPANPSGTPTFETTTTTTTTNPPLYYPTITPINSGITSFTIVNDYIHYYNYTNDPIRLQPSSLLVVANVLFNQYSAKNRAGTFESAERYKTNPS